MRQRLRTGAGKLARRPALVVGIVVVSSALLAGAFSIQVVRFQPDELVYTHLAMAISRSFSPFTRGYGSRINQLYPLLIAPLWGAFGNVTAFRLTHVWNALLLASAAVPSYLLAREVIRSRPAAYVAAGLVAVAPWLTLATAELTEVAAFPACAWALLAMQRALALPSPRRDLIALSAIAVAAFARLQLVVLAPLLVAAAIIHEVGFVLAGRSRPALWTALRHAGSRSLRSHAVLGVAALVGVAAGVPLLLSGVLAKAAGFYGNTLTGATVNAATFDLARSYVAFIALGVGAIPAALGFGFVFETLLVPVSRRLHAFASLLVVTVLGLTLQVAEVSVRFNHATLQERYLFYIAPLLIVGMCCALLATRHPVTMALAGSLALGALLVSARYQPSRTPGWYQISPATTSVYDFILPAFGAPGPAETPDPSLLIPVAGVVLALGGVVGLSARRFRAARVLAGVGAAAIAFCAVETIHALSSTVDGDASAPGFGAGTLAGVDWVDRHVPAGAAVPQLEANLGGWASSDTVWEGDIFWNRSITYAYTFGSPVDPYLPTYGLKVNARSGYLSAARAAPDGAQAPAGAPAPGYLVLPTRGFPLVPVGVTLARSPSGVLELMRPARPLRAAWALSGISSGGWLSLGHPGTLRLFLVEGARSCATVSLSVSLSSLAGSPQTVTVRGTGRSSSLRLAPGSRGRTGLRVCGDRRGPADLRISVADAPGPGPLALAPQLVSVQVRPA